VGGIVVSHNFFFDQSEILDPDAARYIRDVQAADGAGLEGGVKRAINKFVIGCKRDGTWDAIKTSWILAGARTLSGALIPLKGTAPTNNNFVSGDYDRKTGLVGNGTTKYLNSNRNNNVDPQNSNHQAVYVSTAQVANPGTATAYMGAGGGADAGATHIGANKAAGELFFRSRTVTAVAIPASVTAIGLIGMSRSSSANFTYRLSGASTVATVGSSTPFNGNVIVFNRLLTSPFTDARFAFYSIGESIDLAKLDTRISTLVATLGVAI